MKKKLIHFMNEHFWGLKQLETQTNEHFRLKKGGEKGPIFSKIYPYFSSKHQKIDSAGVFLLVFQALEVDHERIIFRNYKYIISKVACHYCLSNCLPIPMKSRKRHNDNSETTATVITKISLVAANSGSRKLTTQSMR